MITLVFITLVPTVRKMFIKLFTFVFIFINNYAYFGGSLVAQTVKSLPAVQETNVQSLGWEDPLGRQPAPVFLPGEFHGWRSLTGYSPWGCKELDTAERLHFHLFTFMHISRCISIIFSHMIIDPNKNFPFLYNYMVSDHCNIHLFTIYGDDNVHFPLMYRYSELQASQVAPVVKNLSAKTRCKRGAFHPHVGKVPWRRACQPPPVFLPGDFHEQRSLTGSSPQGRRESDMTDVTACVHSEPH